MSIAVARTVSAAPPDVFLTPSPHTHTPHTRHTRATHTPHTRARTRHPARDTDYIPVSATQTLFTRVVNLHMPHEQLLPPGVHRWRFTFTIPADAHESCSITGHTTCAPYGESTEHREAGTAAIACVHRVIALPPPVTLSLPEATPCRYTVTAATVARAKNTGPSGADTKGKTSSAAPLTVRAAALPHPTGSNTQFFAPRKGQVVANLCCFCCCHMPPAITYSLALEAPGVTDWLAGAPVLLPGSPVRAVATMEHVRGPLIKTWSAWAELRTDMELHADGTTWFGRAAHSTATASGTVEPAGESTLRMALTFPGAVAPLKTPIATCTPHMVLRAKPNCPIMCSGFPAVPLTLTLPFHPRTRRAATAAVAAPAAAVVARNAPPPGAGAALASRGSGDAISESTLERKTQEATVVNDGKTANASATRPDLSLGTTTTQAVAVPLASRGSNDAIRESTLERKTQDATVVNDSKTADASAVRPDLGLGTGTTQAVVMSYPEPGGDGSGDTDVGDGGSSNVGIGAGERVGEASVGQ